MPTLTGVSAADPPGAHLVDFTWTADPNPLVTSYDVEVGSAPGLTDRGVFAASLEAFSATLTDGVYYWRIRSLPTGAVSSDQMIVVSGRLGRLRPQMARAVTGIAAPAVNHSVSVLAGPAEARLAGLEERGALGLLSARSFQSLQVSTETGRVTVATEIGITGFQANAFQGTAFQLAAGPAITIIVTDWTRQVQVGFRGRVAVEFVHSRPLVRVQVRIGGQAIAQIDGAELRDVAGITFSVPRLKANYPLTVSAQDDTGLETVTTAARWLEVI